MSRVKHAGSRILLVEDNETIRNAFSLLLEESGYEILQAATGRLALDSAVADQPHLVLLDLGLPDMSGLDVVRTLAADPRTSNIPVVALTGRALKTDEDACRAAGCVGYLTKPINTHHLLQEIPRYLADIEE